MDSLHIVMQQNESVRLYLLSADTLSALLPLAENKSAVVKQLPDSQISPSSRGTESISPVSCVPVPALMKLAFDYSFYAFRTNCGPE